MRSRSIAAFLLFVAPLCLRAGAVEKPLPVRGWLIHNPEPAYVNRVLAAAPAFGVNHLDLSHDIVMNADEVTDKPGRAAQIEDITRRAAKKGIRCYIWAHELNTENKSQNLDPATADGARFWESRRAAYRRALAACPSIAGVVLMYGSSPTELWEIRGADPFWRGLSMPDRVRYVTDLVKSVVVGEFHKELIVRDFNHSPDQLRWIIEGLRDFPGITVYSKVEPQDFELFYPQSPAVGAFGRTRQILEIDLNGEYWGQSIVPVCQVGYIRYRLRYGVARHVAGAVGRIDTYGNAALGTPNELNVFAFSRILADPEITEQRILDEWMSGHYRLKADSAPARTLERVLRRTFEVAKRTYYTLGFWTWKNQSTIPPAVANIDGGIRTKSIAKWDPRYKALERRMLRPDAELVRSILAEKARAVSLADANVRECALLKGHIAGRDYRDLSSGLAIEADLARAYEALAGAYWRVKLVPSDPAAPEADLTTVRRAIDNLVTVAARLDARYAAIPDLIEQAARLRQFASSATRQLR